MEYPAGYFVDNAWKCKECGALNSATREICGRCNNFNKNE